MTKQDSYEENDTLRQALIELRGMINDTLASFTPPDEDDDDDDEDEKKDKNEDGEEDDEDDDEDDEDGLQV